MEVDFQTIQDAIGIAGDTGSAASKVAKAAEAIKELFGSSKSGADPDVKLAMSELMLQVANTQAANAQLIQRLTTLETEIKAAQAQQTDFHRYELWQTPAGTLVYRLKESDDTGEPQHLLCPNCMQQKRKSILQGQRVVNCPACTTSYRIESPPPRKPKPAGRRW